MSGRQQRTRTEGGCDEKSQPLSYHVAAVVMRRDISRSAFPDCAPHLCGQCLQLQALRGTSPRVQTGIPQMCGIWAVTVRLELTAAGHRRDVFLRNSRHHPFEDGYR